MKIDSIGIDGDGILTELDMWQYAVGLEKLTGIKLLDLVYNQEFETLEELIEYFEKAYLRKRGINVDLNEVIKNPNAYHIREIFGISKMRELAIATFAFIKYCRKYKFRQEASEVINQWHDDGREIHIITARKFISDDSFVLFRGIVRGGFMKLMKDANIPYDTITFCSETNAPAVKRDACLKHEVKLMFEDRPDIIEAVSQVADVGCFDATYNRKSTGATIHRVHNGFYGADELVNELEKVR